jgi:hypothetical protein
MLILNKLKRSATGGGVYWYEVSADAETSITTIESFFQILSNERSAIESYEVSMNRGNDNKLLVCDSTGTMLYSNYYKRKHLLVESVSAIGVPGLNMRYFIETKDEDQTLTEDGKWRRLSFLESC